MRSGSRSHQGCSAHSRPAIASAPSVSLSSSRHQKRNLIPSCTCRGSPALVIRPTVDGTEMFVAGLQKIRVVWHIEEFAAKLRFHALEDREILEKADIEDYVARSK